MMLARFARIVRRSTDMEMMGTGEIRGKSDLFLECHTSQNSLALGGMEPQPRSALEGQVGAPVLSRSFEPELLMF